MKRSQGLVSLGTCSVIFGSYSAPLSFHFLVYKLGINMMPPKVVMRLNEALEVTAPTSCRAQRKPQLSLSAVAECGLSVQIQAQPAQWLCDLRKVKPDN